MRDSDFEFPDIDDLDDDDFFDEDFLDSEELATLPNEAGATTPPTVEDVDEDAAAPHFDEAPPLPPSPTPRATRQGDDDIFEEPDLIFDESEMERPDDEDLAAAVGRFQRSLGEYAEASDEKPGGVLAYLSSVLRSSEEVEGFEQGWINFSDEEFEAKINGFESAITELTSRLDPEAMQGIDGFDEIDQDPEISFAEALLNFQFPEDSTEEVDEQELEEQALDEQELEEQALEEQALEDEERDLSEDGDEEDDYDEDLIGDGLDLDDDEPEGFYNSLLSELEGNLDEDSELNGLMAELHARIDWEEIPEAGSLVDHGLTITYYSNGLESVQGEGFIELPKDIFEDGVTRVTNSMTTPGGDQDIQFLQYETAVGESKTMSIWMDREDQRTGERLMMYAVDGDMRSYSTNLGRSPLRPMEDREQQFSTTTVDFETYDVERTSPTPEQEFQTQTSERADDRSSEEQDKPTRDFEQASERAQAKSLIPEQQAAMDKARAADELRMRQRGREQQLDATTFRQFNDVAERSSNAVFKSQLANPDQSRSIGRQRDASSTDNQSTSGSDSTSASTSNTTTNNTAANTAVNASSNAAATTTNNSSANTSNNTNTSSNAKAGTTNASGKSGNDNNNATAANADNQSQGGSGDNATGENAEKGQQKELKFSGQRDTRSRDPLTKAEIEKVDRETRTRRVAEETRVDGRVKLEDDLQAKVEIDDIKLDTRDEGPSIKGPSFSSSPTPTPTNSGQIAGSQAQSGQAIQGQATPSGSTASGPKGQVGPQEQSAQAAQGQPQKDAAAGKGTPTQGSQAKGEQARSERNVQPEQEQQTQETQQLKARAEQQQAQTERSAQPQAKVAQEQTVEAQQQTEEQSKSQTEQQQPQREQAQPTQDKAQAKIEELKNKGPQGLQGGQQQDQSAQEQQLSQAAQSKTALNAQEKTEQTVQADQRSEQAQARDDKTVQAQEKEQLQTQAKQDKQLEQQRAEQDKLQQEQDKAAEQQNPQAKVEQQNAEQQKVEQQQTEQQQVKQQRAERQPEEQTPTLSDIEKAIQQTQKAAEADQAREQRMQDAQGRAEDIETQNPKLEQQEREEHQSSKGRGEQTLAQEPLEQLQSNGVRNDGQVERDRQQQPGQSLNEQSEGEGQKNGLEQSAGGKEKTDGLFKSVNEKELQATRGDRLSDINSAKTATTKPESIEKQIAREEEATEQRQKEKEIEQDDIERSRKPKRWQGDLGI